MDAATMIRSPADNAVATPTSTTNAPRNVENSRVLPRELTFVTNTSQLPLNSRSLTPAVVGDDCENVESTAGPACASVALAATKIAQSRSLRVGSSSSGLRDAE